MKALNKIKKNVVNLGVLFLLALFGSADAHASKKVYKIYRTLNVRDAMGLPKVYGIKASTPGFGRYVEVRVYAKENYTTGGRDDTNGFLYGSYTGIHDIRDNSASRSLTGSHFIENRWEFEYVPAACVVPIPIVGPLTCFLQGGPTATAYSTDYKSRLFNAATTLVNAYGGFDAYGGEPIEVHEETLEVVIELELNSSINDVKEISLPGIELLYPQDFEKPAERIMRIFKNPLDYPNYCIVAAHRGYWKDVPENTLEAYDRTIATGADMVELDVRFTKDKKLVVFHDMCLDRITNGTGYISDKTWPEIQSLFLKDRLGNITTYKMVSLEEVLTHLKDKILINFDIKERNTEANPDAFWEAMEASISLATSLGVLDQLIIKAKYSPNKIDTQLAKANVTLKDLIYTPVAFGWDTSNMDGYVDSYINKEEIAAIELTYKTDYDPILQKIAPTINNGVRVGNYSFWPEECGGVWSEDLIFDVNNPCQANGRDYNFLYESTGSAIVGDSYASSTEFGNVDNTKPDFLNDGRGDWDWIMKYGANFIITDRPTMLIDYLEKRGLRDDVTPLITELKLDSITATIKNSSPVAKHVVKLEGIGRKISDYRKVEFFTPDTREDCVDCDLMNNTDYSNGKTKTWCEALIASSGTCTCEDIYGTPTYPGLIPSDVDISTLNESDIRKYPLHTLPEWSKIYEGYDIYINANFFDVKSSTPLTSPSSRVTISKFMYQTPCTDVFGVLKPNDVNTLISNDYEPSDPISDQFDALYWLESGEIKMVDYGSSDPYYDKAVMGVTGYILAENGVKRDLNNMSAGQRDVPKKRTVIGINGYELVVLNTTTQVTPDDIVTYLIIEHNYKSVFMFDAGGSSQMLSSTGMYPNRDIRNEAGTGITSSNIPRDLNLTNERVFRPIPTFLAIKEK